MATRPFRAGFQLTMAPPLAYSVTVTFSGGIGAGPASINKSLQSTALKCHKSKTKRKSRRNSNSNSNSNKKQKRKRKRKRKCNQQKEEQNHRNKITKPEARNQVGMYLLPRASVGNTISLYWWNSNKQNQKPNQIKPKLKQTNKQTNKQICNFQNAITKSTKGAGPGEELKKSTNKINGYFFFC